MQFGIADYGLSVWEGGLFDPELRWQRLKDIGYQGTERLTAVSADDAMHKAALLHRMGMDYATCLGPNPEMSLAWTAALRKDYVWTSVTGQDFDSFCRQVNHQVEACAGWNVRVGLHNHLGSLVEMPEQVDEFLARCPGCGLILDTAHLAAAGGDPAGTVRRYPDRLVAIHLKDWLLQHPDADQWWARGRFCELGAGNIGLDNIAVMRALVEVGYDGWVFVEQDTHLQDPYRDLAISREYLRKAGF